MSKIKNQAAFTLGEALVAVIILLLATSIVVAGIPAAIRAYDNVIVASNAEVLLSTTVSALRNELSTARDISASGTDISYYNQSTKTRSKIYIGGASSGPQDIMYQRYASTETSNDPRLVSKEASDLNMELHVSYKSVTYSNGLVKFTGLAVTRKDGNATPASIKKPNGESGGELTIRVISYAHDSLDSN